MSYVNTFNYEEIKDVETLKKMMEKNKELSFEKILKKAKQELAEEKQKEENAKLITHFVKEMLKISQVEIKIENDSFPTKTFTITCKNLYDIDEDALLKEFSSISHKSL